MNDPTHTINKKNSRGFNAFYLAAKNGNQRAIEFLVENHSNPYEYS